MTKMVHIAFVYMLILGLSIPLFAQSSFLDPTFGTNGRATSNGPYEEGHAVAIQSDGKIVVAGYSSNDTSNHVDFDVVRFNPDGSLDNTFGVGGTALTNIAGGDSSSDRAYAVAIQQDGKILVAGQSEDTSNSQTHSRFALARFNSNGTLDNTFGAGGTVIDSISGGGLTDVGESIALLPDGRIIVAGVSYPTFSVPGGLGAVGPALGVARFNSNGTPDRTFGMNGSIEAAQIGVPFYDLAYSVAVQPDGKIVCASGSIVNESTGQTAFAVVRLDSNGTIDNTFGSSGVASTFIAGGDSTEDVGYSVAVESDGKIVVAGLSGGELPSNAGITSIAVARFNPDGTSDPTFGTNGTARINPTGPDSSYTAGYSVAIQSDGKIVVAGRGGYFGPAFAVARFDSNGTVDQTFGSDGIALADSFETDDAEDVANSVAIQSDGKIVAAGYSTGNAGGEVFAVARFLPSNVTAIKEINSTPKSFALYQNYPNPFNPTTAITYQLSANSHVTLKVYDILGREVATLVNQKEIAGSHSVTFDGSRLASGVYFYRLVAGSYTATKKLILIK